MAGAGGRRGSGAQLAGSLARCSLYVGPRSDGGAAATHSAGSRKNQRAVLGPLCAREGAGGLGSGPLGFGAATWHDVVRQARLEIGACQLRSVAVTGG